MNKIQSVLIQYILRADNDQLSEMLIAAAGYLVADRDALDSVNEAIITHLQTMSQDERVMVLRFIHSVKDFRGV